MSKPPAIALASGIYRIPTMGDFINSYAFVEADGSVTLVDCGISRAPAKIVAGLAGIGRHPTDVTRIILTHAHSDHAGGAQEMVQRTGQDGVSVHADDVEYLAAGRTAKRWPHLGDRSGRLVDGCHHQGHRRHRDRHR